MTTGQEFEKKGKYKHGLCSSLSNSVWSDLNSKGGILKLHEMGPNNECNCEKQSLVTPTQFCFEGASFLDITQKVFGGTKEAGDDTLEPTSNVAAPFIGMAVGAKSKNPALAQTTTNILISRPGCHFLRFTDMHVNGF